MRKSLGHTVATCRSVSGAHTSLPLSAFSFTKPGIRNPKLKLSMKCVLSCAAVFVLPLLVSPALGGCGAKEYSLSASKCCKKCSPGEQMQNRCTLWAETQCVPCEPGYYSQDFSEDSSCTACTICDQDRGLQEVKKCETVSNTVCTCLPGYSPPPDSELRKGCNPCPTGHFSKGGNDRCRPWTNCTAKGRKLFRAGRREVDAICNDQPSMSPQLTVATRLRDTLAIGPKTTPSTLATSAKEEPSRANTRGFLMIFLMCASVVLATGGSVLCLLKSKQRRKKLRTLEVPFQGDRKSSYRIPIQEEQVDYKSSLTQN